MSAKELHKKTQNNTKEYFETFHNENKIVEEQNPIMINDKTDEAIKKAVIGYVKEIVSKPSEKREPNI